MMHTTKEKVWYTQEKRNLQFLSRKNVTSQKLIVHLRKVYYTNWNMYLTKEIKKIPKGKIYYLFHCMLLAFILIKIKSKQNYY